MPHANLYPWQIRPQYGPSYRPGTVPVEALEYLRSDNPRLLEIGQAYRVVDDRVTRPVIWIDGKLSAADLVHFRGQNPFINQLSGLNFNELSYALSYYALKASAAADLLEKLDEDGLFGVHTFRVEDRLISRDLLDSVGEIDFIRRHVGLSDADTNIIDIGAGYGRLAHRLTEATDANVRVYATDAFAPSTFLAEYYLKFRKADRASVVLLSEVEAFLKRTKVKLATNIHSFSECSLEAIDWWVSRLAVHEVPYLFVLPNRIDPATGACLTNLDEEMEPILDRHGYRVKVREPRYADPAIAKYAVDPALFSLFELAKG